MRLDTWYQGLIDALTGCLSLRGGPNHCVGSNFVHTASGTVKAILALFEGQLKTWRGFGECGALLREGTGRSITAAERSSELFLVGQAMRFILIG